MLAKCMAGEAGEPVGGFPFGGDRHPRRLYLIGRRAETLPGEGVHFSLVVTILARLVMPAPRFPRFHGDDSGGRLAGIQNSRDGLPLFPFSRE